jgi:alpha-L-rhamnosidase
MHRTIGGLAPLEPGYHRLEICPRPGGGLTHCRVAHFTPYGLAQCVWKIENGKIDLDVIIPANTTASVTLPGEKNSLDVGSGAWHWSVTYQDPDARGPYTVDDLVGEILGEPVARTAIMDVLERMEIPGFLQMVIFSQRNIPLRQALQKLPNYEEAVMQLSEALVGR